MLAANKRFLRKLRYESVRELFLHEGGGVTINSRRRDYKCALAHFIIPIDFREKKRIIY